VRRPLLNARGVPRLFVAAWLRRRLSLYRRRRGRPGGRGGGGPGGEHLLFAHHGSTSPGHLQQPRVSRT